MNSNQKEYIKFSHAETLMPQEEMLEISKKKSNLTIGLPKESIQQENRICLVPKAVGLLVKNGHKVLVENDAGKAAQFSDNEYSEAGGQIVNHSEEIFKADIILKVAPLTDNEIKLLKSKQAIFSSLQLPSQDKNYFKKLITKKSTAIAFEKIQDKSGTFPVIRSISEIIGATSIFIAAEYLCNPEYGKGSMLGGFTGITPTEVVILGAGTVAENAARVAMGMGAMVKIFDNSIYKLRRLQNNLGTRLFTSIFQPEVLLKSLKTADVVIGAVHSSEGMTPCLVSEDMVRQMKYGSVIIDVSIDQGGCVETSSPTTHKNPVFKKYDVTHYCVPNIASMVPHTASYALSNLFAPIILKIGEAGGVENYLKSDFGLCKGVYLFNGILTNEQISELYGIPFQNIELLMAAFQ